MTAYIIGYDLKKQHQNYTDLIDAIKKISPTHWHILDSTWIVSTSLNASQIRDRLSPFVDSNDKLLVAKLSGEAAWKGFDDAGSKWLKDVLS
mgnify:CR=1 FL=1